MFSTEPQPDMAKEIEMHAQRHRAAVYALKEMVRASMYPERASGMELSELVQREFGLSEIEAQGAIHDAKRSLQLLEHDDVLSGIVKETMEDKSE